MRKWNAALLSLGLALCLLSACGRSAETGSVRAAETATPLRIVATIFPAYDWTRQILGDRTGAVELTLLMDSGTDLHNYQPTVDDMVTLSTCDLFLCVGGASDAWVEDALAEAVNRDMTVIRLLDALGDGAKVEETVEGMQEEDEDEADEYDEHVWLSVRNARRLCGVIADALCALDPAHADEYAENLAAYLARLDALDAAYQEAVDAAAVRTLVFADRFPFRYLVDDYGLDYYAAFAGCSAETEASFETVIFLAEKVDALRLPAVLTIEGGDGKIARTVVENTAAKSARILQMDSLQSVTARDVENGAAYLAAMEENLAVLRAALDTGE